MTLRKRSVNTADPRQGRKLEVTPRETPAGDGLFRLVPVTVVGREEEEEEIFAEH
jgi:hypothetical protein